MLEKFNHEKIETSPEPNASFLSVLDNISVKHRPTITPKKDNDEVVHYGISSQKKDLTSKYKYISQFDSSQPPVEVEEEIPDELWDDEEFVDTSKPFESLPITDDVDLDMNMHESPPQNAVKFIKKISSEG